MKIIITYGTFDLFHIGHVRLLKRLKSLGDKLYVGISSDEFNKQKGKKSFFSFDERAEIVSSCKYVDLVFKENSWDQKRDDITKYHADVFAMGDDWSGKFDHLASLCEVVYLPRTEDISTTDIKKSLSTVDQEKLNELEDTMSKVIDIVKFLKIAGK